MTTRLGLPLTDVVCGVMDGHPQGPIYHPYPHTHALWSYFIEPSGLRRNERFLRTD